MSIAVGCSMISPVPWICTNLEPLYCSPKISMDTRGSRRRCLILYVVPREVMITRPSGSIPGVTKVICGQPSSCRTAIQARWFCRKNFCASAISIFSSRLIEPLTVTVGAPGSAVDPHFSELKHVGIGLSPGVKRRAPPAENRNVFGLLVFYDHYRGAREPFPSADLFGIELNAVTAVGFGAHQN